MRGIRIWARLLGLRRAVIEDVWVGEEGEVVVATRANWRERDRCGVCRRRCAWFDLGEGRRRWRALDLGTTFAFVEAEAARVSCRRHGVVVCAVPWARLALTRALEDQFCWLPVNTSRTCRACPAAARPPRSSRRGGLGSGRRPAGSALELRQPAGGRGDRAAVVEHPADQAWEGRGSPGSFRQAFPGSHRRHARGEPRHSAR